MGETARPPAAGDAWLVLRMAAWSIALPALKHVVPLRTLVKLAWAGSKTRRTRVRERRIVRLSGALPRLRLPHRHANCLERSLLAYRFLAEANADPTLVVGVARAESGVQGHAWVLVDGRPVHEDEASLRSFVPLIEFGREGRATGGVGEPLPDRWE